MEEHTEDQTKTPAGAATPPPRSGGVMDIQPPKGQPDIWAHDEPTPAPTPTPAPAAPTPSPEPNLKPSTPEIIAPPEKQTEGLPKHIEEHTDHLLAAHADAHHKKPVLAIVVAIIIGLSLIGLTVFAYMQTKDGTKDAGDHGTETHQESGASAADVDDTTKQVDDTLNTVDDTKDMPETDLTDQSLGL